MHRLILPIAIIHLSGCIVLPIPHRRMHECGVTGTLKDDSGKPLPNAYVSGVMELNPDHTVTDPNGNFRLPPTYGWHAGILIGPVSSSILPGLGGANQGHRVIKVKPENAPTRAIWIEQNHDENDIMHAGEIKLPPTGR